MENCFYRLLGCCFWLAWMVIVCWKPLDVKGRGRVLGGEGRKGSKFKRESLLFHKGLYEDGKRCHNLDQCFGPTTFEPPEGLSILPCPEKLPFGALLFSVPLENNQSLWG